MLFANERQPAFSGRKAAILAYSEWGRAGMAGGCATRRSCVELFSRQLRCFSLMVIVTTMERAAIGGSMLRVKGVYEDGGIRLLEDVSWNEGAKVLVTVATEEETFVLKGEPLPPGFFDDLVGAAEGGPDDSEKHDLLILGVE